MSSTNTSPNTSLGSGQDCSKCNKSSLAPSITAKLAERQDPEAVLAKQELKDNGELGLQVTELNSKSARQFGHNEEDEGVLVVGVKPGSKADEAGIQQGDLLKEVNRKPVDSVKSLKSELKDKSGDSLQILVKRPSAGYLVVTIS